MKRLLLFLSLLFIASFAFAQKPLTDSRKEAVNTYIYRVEDDITLLFLNGYQYRFKDNMLKDLVAEYANDHPVHLQLGPGNYLQVTAEKNKLAYKLLQKPTAFLTLLENDHDTRFILTDTNGNEIADAQVSIGKRTINYDKQIENYHAPRRKADTLIKVLYKGVSNFYKVAEQKVQPYRNNNYNYTITKTNRPNLWRRLKTAIAKLFERKVPVDPTPRYSGYIALNKPKYRPGDTVKFKAFILQSKSKAPINDAKLNIRLKNREWDDGKIIGQVSAYRKGAFEYQFKLTDSLDMKLDNNYIICLEALPDGKPLPERKPFQPPPQQGLTIYKQESFMYEDYELRSITFNMRTDREEQSPGLPAAVYFKAVDENNLPVPDGRVKITLTSGSTWNFDAPRIFVPDTLWKKELTLDPVGETRLNLPDTIFPRANLSFTLKAVFLNSDNESREAQKVLSWNYNDKKIDTKTEHDSLTIKYLVAGKNTPAKATISQLNIGRDTVSTFIDLPAKIAINHNVTEYLIRKDQLKEYVYSDDPGVELSGYRMGDSVFVKANNPYGLKLHYIMYAGNKVLEEGTTNAQLNYRKHTSKPQTIFIRVNYIWGTQLRASDETIFYQDKYLNIDVKQPATVYPGQQAMVELGVTDNSGKPVANADITAFSITKKFENYHVPAVPYLGKYYPIRKAEKPWLDRKLLQTWGNLKLNWQYWSRQMGLDTIQYYRFTHPDSTYQIVEPSPDSITQIAPFVIKDGEVMPVHILYIDEKPVYFSQSMDMQRYSFAVQPGYHYLRFRTADQLIRLNRMIVPVGRKMILSVNGDSLINKQAVIKKMPDTLMKDEANAIDRYMITIVPNFGNKLATLEQDDKLFLLNYNYDGLRGRYYTNQQTILVGPLFDNVVNMDVKNGFSREFMREGGYSFELQSDLVKQRSLPTYPFNKDLRYVQNAFNTDYSHYVLRPKEVDTLWQNLMDERAARDLNIYSYNYSTTDGKLIIKPGSLKNGREPFIKSIIISKTDDPGFIQIRNGRSTDLGRMPTGNYRLYFLLKGNSYYLLTNVDVRPNGTNLYSTGVIEPHAPDSVSQKVGLVLNSEEFIYNSTIAQNIKELLNGKYVNIAEFDSQVTGQVLDGNTKKPLAGATIFVADTKISVMTDRNGKFKIRTPKRGKLRVTALGYIIEDINIDPSEQATIYLMPSGHVLNATTIKGYVKRNREETTGSSYIIAGQDNPVGNAEQLLQGKVAGINIQNNTGAPGMRGSVNIRGLSLINGKEYAGGTPPLYVIDGVVSNAAAFVSIPQDMIVDISVLKDAAATAIYGNGGMYGVIMVTTKKGATQFADAPGQQQNLRRNFNDYAYWYPRLTTDVNGKARFKVTYPDDITNWRTFVIGMTDKRQSGFVEGQVKAFKPISANFVSPLFAVRGDSFSPLGKAMNYTQDTVKLERRFTYNDKLLKDDKLVIANAHIDTFKLTADGKDSLRFEFSVKRSNGYFDGEKRTIPLFEQGSLETKGSFDALEKDTTINLRFDPNLKVATIRAESTIWPALLDETEHLRTYEYLCNEQLASKLKALLAEKAIRKYLGEDFKWDKDITDIIKKLMESRSREGTWGWWKDTPEELWISYHVVDALLDAQSNGFSVPANKQALIDYYIYRLTIYNGPEKLTDVQLLKRLDAKADLQAYVKQYEKSLSPKHPVSDMERYQLIYTRQLVGMPVNIDSLLKGMQHTMFGNIYWGGANKFDLFSNSIQQSLVAYRILKAEGKHPQLLGKLRNYFLEQRSNGYWRNTFESAQILVTILPDMLVAGQKPRPAQLQISGGKTETVTKFPYTTTVAAGSKLTISKTGDMPVYFTAYQQFWNTEPKKVSADFTVDTWFQKGKDKITTVKGGEAITLTAEVTARADADFVMIEIPIPAGCSYDSKEQGYYNGEVHREYFKNKVSIFCRKLTAGKYTYKVQLMPRYGGSFHVNPAKAEMMYFPVFYGREAMKMLDIN